MSAEDEKDRRIAELTARVAELESRLYAPALSDVSQESEELFRALAEGMPQLIFATDETGGRTYFNGRWKVYTGFDPDEKGSYRQLVHPDDLESADQFWAASRRSGRPLEYEYRLRDKNGSYRWFLVRGWPVRNAAGTVVRWIGTATRTMTAPRSLTRTTLTDAPLSAAATSGNSLPLSRP